MIAMDWFLIRCRITVLSVIGKATNDYIMKWLLILIIALNSLTDLYSQSNSELIKLVDDFKNVKDMPYICETLNYNETAGCGDSIFWDAIRQGDKILPYLLDRLDDTAISKAIVPVIGGNYTVGDISFFALTILIWDIPVLDFAEDVNNPEPRDGYNGYWNYTRRSCENRKNFKNRVNEWYNSNNGRFIWINSGHISGCDCKVLNNPAGGHFKLEELYAVFVGTVVKIEKEPLKEGLFDKVTFKVDSIIKLDTTSGFNDRNYLNKKRNKAILLENPTDNKFELGVKYEVYVGCCQVDYYINLNRSTRKCE